MVEDYCKLNEDSTFKPALNNSVSITAVGVIRGIKGANIYWSILKTYPKEQQENRFLFWFASSAQERKGKKHYSDKVSGTIIQGPRIGAP